MIKTGILTFHYAQNYGANLQAYALQKTIENLGFKCEIIDYQNSKNSQKRKNVIYGSLTLKKLAYFILTSPRFYKRLKRFDKFQKNYYKLSPVYKLQNIKEANQLYDKFITGSDQVWNHDITEFDKIYFLDFVDKEKSYSYAASFGFSELSSEYAEEYKRLLSDFKKISVRETAGRQIIKNLLDTDCNVLCDPSLLLEKSEWEKLIKKPIIKSRYVLIYAFDFSEKQLIQARYLADKFNLKIYVFDDLPFNKHGLRTIKGAGPLEFLNLIKNAEYVITNSFHGIMFSLIFNKELYVEYRKNTGLSMNSRIEEVFNKFDLSSRLIDKIELKEKINYDAVNQKIIAEREKAINYLKGILNE